MNSWFRFFDVTNMLIPYHCIRVTSLEQLSVAEFSGESARPMVYEKCHKNVLPIWLDLVSNIKNWAHFEEIKYIKNQSYQNMSTIKVVLLFLYSSMKIFFRKIRLIFDIEKWLWKSEFCYIWPSIPNQAKCLRTFLWPFS